MSILLHAPNVHTGGGLRLLGAVLAAAPKAMRWAQLDERVAGRVDLRADMVVHYVPRSIIGRLVAEWRLFRQAGPKDTVLAFNGLPPLFALRAPTVVFLQSILLVQKNVPRGYTPLVQTRLIVERLWFRLFRHKRIRYIVQTTSMADVLRRRIGDGAEIRVSPFIGKAVARSSGPSQQAEAKTYDFVYTATGEVHKNHHTLLEAWVILAEHGERPRLALTIDRQRHPALSAAIDAVSMAHNLRIENLGTLSFDDVTALYAASGALIFPSTAESFGLPLIEAVSAGLPVLAPELDYVRDVVIPSETFDPSSARSIARAVLRFLGRAELPLEPVLPEKFLADVVQ